MLEVGHLVLGATTATSILGALTAWSIASFLSKQNNLAAELREELAQLRAFLDAKLTPCECCSQIGGSHFLDDEGEPCPLDFSADEMLAHLSAEEIEELASGERAAKPPKGDGQPN